MVTTRNKKPGFSFAGRGSKNMGKLRRSGHLSDRLVRRCLVAFSGFLLSGDFTTQDVPIVPSMEFHTLAPTCT